MEEPPLFYAGQQPQGIRWLQPEKSDDSLQSGHQVLGRMSPQYNPSNNQPTHVLAECGLLHIWGSQGLTTWTQASNTIHQTLFPMLASALDQQVGSRGGQNVP